MSCWRWLGLGLLLPLSLACGPLDIEEVEDAEGEGEVSVGKADGPSFSACIEAAILALVNDPATDGDLLKSAGLTITVRKNILEHRDGADGLPGGGDDDLFGDLAELDAIKYVGPKVLGALARLVEAACPEAMDGEAEVVFSPQPYAQSHVARLVELIDTATSSLDIAMYNLSDSGVKKALGRAIQRGVKIRFLSEDAHAEAKNPAGTGSAALEELGIDVRYVNKIMHHKFMIMDGPRSSLEAAATATLATGSGNWSTGAATRYDENTLFLSGVPRLALAYQAEFNLLWEHSSDLVWKSYPLETGLAIDRAAIPADASVDAAFTSDNFTVAPGSTTFKVQAGRNTIAEVVVKAIQGARKSIHVASGHLRSRSISEALMAAKQANPSLDVKVYLDGQEYLSASTHQDQLNKLQTCLAAAGSISQQQACQDKGFLFSYQVSQAGVALKYKYYAYRWDYSYAKQMHNKYFVIDGKTLITGSYNLSDNAEHNTFENMAILRAPAYSDLIARYEQSFQRMWETDADGSLLASLTSKIKTAASIPLVFEPMALTWQQVSSLKTLIAQNCPAANSLEYRQSPAEHQSCPR